MKCNVINKIAINVQNLIFVWNVLKIMKQMVKIYVNQFVIKIIVNNVISRIFVLFVKKVLFLLIINAKFSVKKIVNATNQIFVLLATMVIFYKILFVYHNVK